MYYTTITMRCPFCETVLYKRYKVGSSKEKQWGSPLIQCSKCNKIVIDKSFEEIGVYSLAWWKQVEPPKTADVYSKIGYSLMGFTFIVPAFGVSPVFALLLFLTSIIFHGIAHSQSSQYIGERIDKDFLAHHKQSCLRLSSPEYVEVLKALNLIDEDIDLSHVFEDSQR